MSLLIALSRRLHSYPSLLQRQSSLSRCTSSSSPLQLDPLVAEVLNEPKSSFSRPMRTNPVDPAKVNLPPVDLWPKCFPAVFGNYNRVSIRNPKTAERLAEAFVPTGSRGKVIIEAYPGPGQLTRALLNLPKSRIAKIVVMEDHEPFLDYLRPLEQLDSRVKVIPKEGYSWDTYKILQDLDILKDVPKIPWQAGVHPNLHFISHLPSTVYGEQLISQLFRSIPDQQWLFQYGRVPLSFILTEYVWKRISAAIGDRERCKVTLIAEAVASCSEALHPSATSPYEEHFFPARLNANDRKATRRVGKPYQAVHVVPLEDQVIQKGLLDKWDYCLRRLFVKKATPLASAIPGLGPGAQSLLKKITQCKVPNSQEMMDTQKAVRDMTVYEWSVVLKAFDEWPFAPEDLLISDSFTDKT